SSPRMPGISMSRNTTSVSSSFTSFSASAGSVNVATTTTPPHSARMSQSDRIAFASSSITTAFSIAASHLSTWYSHRYFRALACSAFHLQPGPVQPLQPAVDIAQPHTAARAFPAWLQQLLQHSLRDALTVVAHFNEQI